MNDHIPSLIQQHEQFLKEQLRKLDIAAPEIKNAMRYSLLSGGKRFRPLLVYLSAQLFNVPLPVSDVLAASVEMMHCYSLIHDDLPAMDNDDFRRGKPSCHRAFNEATAILAGDALASWSVDILLEQLPRFIAPASIIAITRCLLLACGAPGMISGQSLDLSVLNGLNVTEDNLSMIHKLKTGRLIEACIDMVLLAANAQGSKQGMQLQHYTKELGIAFQMQDDFLDQYATPQSLGKSISSDTANAKYTYAHHLTKDELRAELDTRFCTAISALDIFGASAKPLIELTQKLALRTQLISVREHV